MARAFQYAIFPLAVLVLWQAATELGLIKRNVLPPPLDVLAVWYDLLTGTTGKASRYAGTWWDHALASTWRVFAGFGWGVALGVSMGLLIGLSRVFERMFDPTVQVLRNIPVTAWVPLSLVFFGIGNAPAIFMVVIALFFHMVLATISQIDGVNRNLINVARTMGATKWQTYSRVIIPAILPGLLVVLRMNLFAAWMVVLVAESTGVGYGLGQVIMMARNTFNPSLVFFTIALIGLLGFTFDFILRMLQKRILYWVPETTGVLRGL